MFDLGLMPKLIIIIKKCIGILKNKKKKGGGEGGPFHLGCSFMQMIKNRDYTKQFSWK